MSIGHRISDPNAIKSIVLGGRAHFTLVSPSGTRFTYRVCAPSKETEDGGKKLDHAARVRFVKVLTGSDNYSSYSFLGSIFLDERVRVTYRSEGQWGWRNQPSARPKYVHGKRSRIAADATSAKAFAWFWDRLNAGLDLKGVEFWHEGACARCARKLTVPESIVVGFGPECVEHSGIDPLVLETLRAHVNSSAMGAV